MKKVLVVLLLLTSFFPSPLLARRSTTVVAHVQQVTAGTSSSIDTTGATLIVISSSAVASPGSISDSKSNSYTGLTAISDWSSGFIQSRLSYVTNPTVGSGHTFTVSGAQACMTVAAFSNIDTSTSYDGNESWAQEGAGTFSIPAITPSNANSLLVVGTGNAGDGITRTYDHSMVNIEEVGGTGGNNVGCSIAWAIQSGGPSSISITVTTNTGGSAITGASIASFKTTGGGGVTASPTVNNPLFF